jgi:putative PIN family toxin of toxin-antitoxin system
VLGVTADTNIYVSALNFGGAPARFIDLAQRGLFRLSVSDPIIREVQKVLRREKFGWPEAAVRRVEIELSTFTQHVLPVQTLEIIQADLSDNRILECAVAARSDFIVTGDQHLLRLERYGSIRIVRVTEFLRLLTGQISP